MATTTNVAIADDSGWVEVGTLGKEKHFENSMREREVHFVFSDTTPAATLKGHQLSGTNGNHFADRCPAESKLWIKNASAGAVTIILTE